MRNVREIISDLECCTDYVTNCDKCSYKDNKLNCRGRLSEECLEIAKKFDNVIEYVNRLNN